MKFIKLGVVARPHGLDGSFFLTQDSGKDSPLRQLPSIYLSQDDKRLGPYAIKEASHMNRGWKISVEGFSTIDEIKAHIGAVVEADRSALPVLTHGEFLVQDLVGLPVFENNELIGHISGIEEGKVAPDRWWIKLNAGETIVVPAVSRYVLKVDIKNCRIDIASTKELL